MYKFDENYPVIISLSNISMLEIESFAFIRDCMGE